MDISSQKSDCLSGSKFSRSGSLLRDETRYLLNSNQAMRQKRGGQRRKIWKASKGVWKPCNPLKFHKTAKDLFGKAWSKTREFWRSLEKGLEGAFIPPPLAPPASGLRSRWIVIARSEVAKQPRGREKEKQCSRSSRERRPECMEKRMARFIQEDRPEAGAELAMTEAAYLSRNCSASQSSSGSGMPSSCKCSRVFKTYSALSPNRPTPCMTRASRRSRSIGAAYCPCSRSAT